MTDAKGSHDTWDIHSIDAAREMCRLNNMAGSLVVGHLLRILKLLPEGGASIEIGSGLGKMSFFSGLMGLQVHLLDQSERALESAAKLYEFAGCEVQTHHGDALALQMSLHDQFDLSMSLGVNEHFSGKARQAIFDSHFNVLKKQGRTVIAVPNRHCISYRLAMLVWKMTGRWPTGLYEYGFSRSELFERMRQAGFKEVQVFSGTFAGEDFSHFIVGNFEAAFRKLISTKKTKPSPERSIVPQDVSDIRKRLSLQKDVPLFVNHQSYTWVATGVRP